MAQFKKTKGRDAVLKILEKEGGPVDVAHIYGHLQKEKLLINQATLYRILDFFAENGLINRFEFQEGKQRFEIVKEEHHHLICESCGTVEDMSDCDFEQLEQDIKRKKHFLVKRHSVEIFGLCSDCQK